MGDERQIPREMHLRGVFSDQHGFDFLIAAGTRSVSNNSQILLDNSAGKFLICFKSSLPLFCFLTLYIRDFTPVIVQILSLHTLAYPRNLGPLFPALFMHPTLPMVVFQLPIDTSDTNVCELI